MPTGPVILGGGITPPATLPSQPLDRAWPRRGLASPPPFGRALTYIWKETLVAFSRVSPDPSSVPNEYGEFARNSAGPPAGAPGAFLSVWCHVELEQQERPSSRDTQDLGPTQARYWTIYMDIPLDPNLWPHKGDLVTFNPRQPGGQRTLPIRYVHNPDELSDHMECEVWEAE